MATVIHNEGDLIIVVDEVNSGIPTGLSKIFVQPVGVETLDLFTISGPQSAIFLTYLEKYSSSDPQRCVVWLSSCSRKVIVNSKFVKKDL